MISLHDLRMPQDVEHSLVSWEKDECVTYYVEQRLDQCTFNQRLDIDFPTPYCCDCIYSLGWSNPGLPDISPLTWKEDLDWMVGTSTCVSVQKQRKEDPGFAFRCKRCPTELRPWEGDELFVVRYSLLELYSVPLSQPGQVNVSRRVKNMILNLYKNKCFNCQSGNHKLHIDHILPRSLEGTAVFSNLQPLCEKCGQLKGDGRSEDIHLTDTMFFGPYPSDAFERLFW